MRRMIALLILGSSLALVGTPAFAETQLPNFLETPAQGSDQTVSTQGSDNPDTAGPSTGTIDQAPSITVPENDK